MSDPWQARGIANFQRAAMQVLCISPACMFANQTYNHMLSDDVVKQPVRIEQGHIAVSSAAGLGVELDYEKLAQYHEAYRQQGYASAYDNKETKAGKAFFLPNQ
ncbi:MAG: hypothetical protein EXQ58_00640 [Acidobacteria bacterium]|nr:hypothetical protein [Acidobacteriota bacterium]